MPHQFFLSVPSRLEELATVLHWFRLDSLRQPLQDEQFWTQCEIALVEGFTNAVRHANPPYAATSVDLEAIVSATSLEIRIWDYGRPFDLEAYLKGLPPQPPDWKEEGGRGLPLLRRIADHLTYTRIDDNRNCLHIVKTFHQN